MSFSRKCCLVLTKAKLRSQTTMSHRGAHNQCSRTSSSGALTVSRVAFGCSALRKARNMPKVFTAARPGYTEPSPFLRYFGSGS